MQDSQNALPGAPDPRRVLPGQYNADPNHTQVTWKLNHMGFSTLSGQFGAKSGTITVDPTDLASTELEIVIDTAGLTATSQMFQGHLRGKGFFDVGKFPEGRFVSRSVRQTGPTGAEVTGELTIKGVTRAVNLTVEFVGAGDDPQAKVLTFGCHATGTILRSDFGFETGLPVVGDRVQLDINVAFTKA
ncbi:YceI family protein [Croceicoccus mobilis]|uniref:Lipid/polyisoprenoid-binding YceI-like domain-containing protein n=1 Tax=Croceicoccus mobilis TaxID=1703339 RepID=A0A916Z509_9SPHN|nr:YceI family protein [Croceicoccus mobilis]GGD74886.1 hypothetical protein GCM10010990_25660 [Croceicoccus mobilis]